MPASFLFDLNSPYAYLAAERLQTEPTAEVSWTPIVFGALLRAQDRVPWSLRAGEREAGIAEIQRRAGQRGLPPVTWPGGWPRETYSIPALRSVTWALSRDPEQGRRLALELFRAMFVHSRALSDPEVVRDAASAVGTDSAELAAAIERQSVKSALRADTERAIALGVPGVPTVVVGDQLFWGDDRLVDALAVLHGS